MPVLPVARQKQPWMTNQPSVTSRVKPRTYIAASPQSPRIPSLVASPEAEVSPASPTRQGPSNDVVGGAFVGAVLGFMLLLLLIRYYRVRGRDDGSEHFGPTSPPKNPQPTAGSRRYDFKPPTYPEPVARPVGRSRRTSIYHPQVMGTQFNGESVLGVRRNPRRRRPSDHGPAEPVSISSLSSSEGSRMVYISLILSSCSVHMLSHNAVSKAQRGRPYYCVTASRHVITRMWRYDRESQI